MSQNCFFMKEPERFCVMNMGPVHSLHERICSKKKAGCRKNGTGFTKRVLPPRDGFDPSNGSRRIYMPFWNRMIKENHSRKGTDKQKTGNHEHCVSELKSRRNQIRTLCSQFPVTIRIVRANSISCFPSLLSGTFHRGVFSVCQRFHSALRQKLDI